MDARRQRFAVSLRDLSPLRLWRAAKGAQGRVVSSGLVLVAAGAALSFAQTPLWWFGGSLLLAGATLLLRATSEQRRALASRLREPRTLLGRSFSPLALFTDVACVAVVLWIGTVMMWEIAGGERPVSHDHTIHYVKAWQLHQHLLPTGRLFGWSHLWFAGFPANYLYPPGTDLWVNAVYALFFGALSFSQAYAVAFWLFHLFTGVAVYRFGRLVGGPYVGLIAAVLCLTDLSNFRMGGWAYTVDYGVWPQSLSLNFSLMALCSLPAIVRERRLAPLGAFGLWMGIAIITHPIQLIVLALLFVCTALAAGFADGVKAATAAFRLGIAYALSVLVSCLWLIPFLSSRSETNAMGVWWDTTYEMAKALLDLRSLEGTLGWVFAFGTLAIVVMLKTRRFLPLFVAFAALCIPAVSNSTFIDEFHLPVLSSAFVKVQFVRLSTMVKPFWFVLAAYFAVAAVAYARRLTLPWQRDTSEPRAPESHVRAALLAGVVGLLALPVLVPTAQAFWTRHVRKSMITESDRQLLADRKQVEHWLTSSLPDDGFYRVGVFTGHNHDMMDLAPLIDRPMWKRGFTPASNFIYQMRDNEPAILDAVNLRFAISKVTLSPDNFDLVKQFGRYRVYRYKRWQPDPFQVIEGEGDVRVERFGDEDIVLRAAPGAHGKLRLNVSYFSRWRAYRDGQRVPITLTYMRESPDNTGFITVDLAPGRYRFAFERTLGDRLAIPLGLLGIALCAVLIAADRRGRIAWLRRALAAVYARLDRLSEPSWGRKRFWLTLIGSAAVLGLGVALARYRPPIELQELGATAIRRVRFDFLEDLSKASANIEYADGNQPCLRQGERLVCRDELGKLDNERYVGSTPANIVEYTMVRCIRARPESNALLSITYPRVPAADAVVGYYGIERAGRLLYRRRPVEFRVMIDGQLVHDGRTQADNKMHWFKAEVPRGARKRTTVTFSVRADNISKRYFCFNAQMVDLK